MKSHEYMFRPRDLIRIIGSYFIATLLLVAALKLLDRIDWLPRPRTIQSMDDVILEHRKTVAGTSTASVVVVGDSSAGICVEAPLLQSLLPPSHEVANQALLMGLPFSIFAETAAPIVTRRSPETTCVVMMLTPTFISREVTSPFHVRMWRNESTNVVSGTPLELLKHRIVIPLFPWSMHGKAGVFYPYVRISRDYLLAHQGSRYDIGWFNSSPNQVRTNWSIPPRYLAEAREFRRKLGKDAKLVLGLSPMPESSVPRGFRHDRDDMLFALNESMQADVLLTNLPATLPNGFCASEAHLNQRGAAYFSRLLAEEMKKQNLVNGEKNP